MKKITWKMAVCFMIAMLLCMPVLTGCEKTEKASEGLEFTSNGDGTCYVSGIGECTHTDVVIPKKSPEGDSVTSIGEYAFGGCKSLTSITIPDTVTSIGESAFSGCTGLTSMAVATENPTYHSDGNCIIETESKTVIAGCQTSVIPTDGSVTSIGDRAFSGLDLTNMNIPDTVTSIGESAFSFCNALTNITIPNSVTSIGEWAFNYCSDLTSITIPDSVTSIGHYAFLNCGCLTSIVVATGNPIYHSDGNCLIETESKTLIVGCQTSVIPADGSVTSIGKSAFYFCTALTSITIPDSVMSIGENAFRMCFGLTSITIPHSVTSIGEWAFADCDGLTSITIGDSVTSIGKCAFTNCAGLTSITIPGSVTSIGEGAFRSCEGLTSLTIPNSVTSIGEGAFRNCEDLADVYYPGTEDQWFDIEIQDGNDSLYSAMIHCTDGDFTFG